MRILLTISAVATFTVAGWAQDQSAQTSTQTTTSSTQSTTTAGNPQTLVGILMDASCNDIASQKTTTKTTSTTNVTVNTGPSSTASTSPDSSVVVAGTPADHTDISRTTVNTKRTDTKVSTPNGTTTRSSADVTRSTQKSTTSNTDPNSPVSSASNTSVSSSSTTVTSADATGTRSRTIDTMVDPNVTAMAGRYQMCQVTPSTTSYALFSNGKVVMLDDAGNKYIKEQMLSNDALKNGIISATGTPQWMTVTVVGPAVGDQMSVTSIETKPLKP